MKTKRQLIVILLTVLPLPLKAESESIAVTAVQQNGEVAYTIKNVSDQTIYISNPQHTGLTVEFVSDNSRGSYEAFPKATTKPWKHLVILTEATEDMPLNWSWRFTVKDDGSHGKFKTLNVFLWIATEKEFLKTTISSFKLVKIPVAISPP